MKIARHLPLLLCFCIGQALADTPIQLRHDATATTHISIRNIAGTVNIIAWDRNELQVGGRLGDGTKPLAITGSKDDLEVKVEPLGGSGLFNWGGDSRMAPTTLVLHVPRAASLAVDVISAPLVIDGMDGGKIDVNAVSAKVRINARTPSLTVDNVSGGIELAGHAEKAELQTVSGDILAPSLGGDAELQTISGRIRVSGGPWRKLTLSTVSGDVQLNGGVTAHGNLDIDSMSGNVQLQLPASTSANLHASSFSGDLHSDFGTPKESGHGPGSSLQTQLGDGQGKINIETFSGDLRVRRQN
ncbi:MAG: DUF4097 family beta strand repeat-containing protein [Rhodanobacter sp.]